MRLLYYIGVWVCFVGCTSDWTAPEPVRPKLIVPQGFPSPEFPEDNAYALERWELGKKLFYDPIMSRDSTVSCNSCHQLEKSFSDGEVASVGIDGKRGTRNAPSLANIAYHPYFTREGGVPTLEMQVLVPIQEHNEFDFNILKIGERLRRIEAYRKLSLSAYTREPDYYVITRALANFERSLLSGNSPYDRYHYQNRKDALNDQEIRGMNLFFSEKTSCGQCHGGFNFTNYAFENNGLYLEYQDVGRFRLTNQEQDRNLFKVPSLRNAEATAPYMHDGSMETLTEVVKHYNEGGAGHPQQSDLIRPLGLSQQELSDLVAFLNSLTDEEFLSNHHFK